MVNYNDVTKVKIKEHNPNLPWTLGHLHRILIVGSSGFGKANTLLNLVKKTKWC